MANERLIAARILLDLHPKENIVSTFCCYALTSTDVEAVRNPRMN
jgi:hypothetical protein